MPEAKAVQSDGWARLAMLAGIAVLLVAVGVGGFLAFIAEDYGAVHSLMETAVLVGLHGGLAAFLLRGGSTQRLDMFDKIVLGMLAISLPACVAAQWLGGQRHSSDVAFEHVLCFTACFVLALPARFLHRQSRLRRLVNASWGACAIAFVLSMAEVWLGGYRRRWWGDPYIEKSIVVALIGSAALAASILACLPTPRVRKTKSAILTLALIWIAAVSGWLQVVGEPGVQSLGVERMTGFFLLLAGISMGIHLIAIRVRSPGIMSVEIRDALTLSTTCPQCRREIPIPPGESACRHCGTMFALRVAPKECIRCGYALTGLRDSKCPECGTVY